MCSFIHWGFFFVKKQLYWGIIDIKKLYVFNIHNLMGSNISLHQWNRYHNQGIRHIQHLQKFPWLSFFFFFFGFLFCCFVARLFNMKSIQYVNCEYYVLCRSLEPIHLSWLKLYINWRATYLVPLPLAPGNHSFILYSLFYEFDSFTSYKRNHAVLVLLWVPYFT